MRGQPRIVAPHAVATRERYGMICTFFYGSSYPDVKGKPAAPGSTRPDVRSNLTRDPHRSLLQHLRPASLTEFANPAFN